MVGRAYRVLVSLGADNVCAVDVFAVSAEDAAKTGLALALNYGRCVTAPHVAGVEVRTERDTTERFTFFGEEIASFWRPAWGN